jgi:Glycosyl transferase family 11
MIISHLLGGLGNQMFQYATGRSVSLARNTSFRLDISAFTNYKLHQWVELNRIFKCAAEVADKADGRRILGWQYSPRILRLLSRHSMVKFRRNALVVEPYFRYWQGITNVPHDCYLIGYWQSERYFLENADQIRKDFRFRQPLDNQNAKLAKLITQQCAISVHVRRGDYASNPKTTATHGLCSLDYYQAAIRYIAERVQAPHFFIFSDDIAWVMNNLTIDFPHQYVKHNHSSESYNDMRLMSLCKHHIIANSSFSWWGAWLNPSTDKIVVAPKQWFANKTDTSDLIPQGWIRL